MLWPFHSGEFAKTWLTGHLPGAFLLDPRDPKAKQSFLESQQQLIVFSNQME